MQNPALDLGSWKVLRDIIEITVKLEYGNSIVVLLGKKMSLLKKSTEVLRGKEAWPINLTISGDSIREIENGKTNTAKC